MNQWLSVLLACLAVLKRSLALSDHDFLMLAHLDVGLVFKELARVGLVEETDDQTCDYSEEKAEAQRSESSCDLEAALIEESAVDVVERVVPCAHRCSNGGIDSVLVRGVYYCAEDSAHDAWDSMQIVDSTRVEDLKFFLENGRDLMEANG